MQAGPDTIHVSIGPGGDKWYHLDGHLFPGHDAYVVPTLDELALTEFAYAAEAFQELGRALEINIVGTCLPEEFTDLYGADRVIWLQVARLWTSAGEAGELVAAALAEAAGILTDVDLADHRSPALAGFVIEGAAQYLVGLGHDLANIALRVAADNIACRRRLEQHKRPSKWVSDVRSGGSGRDAWVFHADAHTMADALQPSRVGAAQLATVAARLEGTKAWRAMSNIRHEYFHRMRYGYATGDATALYVARDFHSATVDAARKVAAAGPALYHAMLAASPRIRSGPGRSARLIGPIIISDHSMDGTTITPERDVFPRMPFRG